MTARTPSQVVAALQRLVPPSFQGDGSWLAGVAAMFARMETLIDDLKTQGLAGTATDEWLDLHASSVGLTRADGEGDDSLDARVHTIEGRLTRAAITTAVDNILVAAGSGARCILREHWCDGLFSDLFEAFDETGTASTGLLNFVDLVDGTPGDVAMQDIWRAFDVAIPAGLDALHPAIMAAIESTRAAGVRGYLSWVPAP